MNKPKLMKIQSCRSIVKFQAQKSSEIRGDGTNSTKDCHALIGMSPLQAGHWMSYHDTRSIYSIWVILSSALFLLGSLDLSRVSQNQMFYLMGLKMMEDKNLRPCFRFPTNEKEGQAKAM